MGSQSRTVRAVAEVTACRRGGGNGAYCFFPLQASPEYRWRRAGATIDVAVPLAAPAELCPRDVTLSCKITLQSKHFSNFSCLSGSCSRLSMRLRKHYAASNDHKYCTTTLQQQAWIEAKQYQNVRLFRSEIWLGPVGDDFGRLTACTLGKFSCRCGRV